MPRSFHGLARIVSPVVVLLAASCASTSMDAVARDRAIRSPDTESVVFWNIQLIDLTGTLSTDSRYCIPSMHLKERDVDNYGSAITVHPAVGTGDAPAWTEGDGFEVYDALMSVSMASGDFVMNSIRVFPGWDQTGNTSISIPVDRRFRLQGGQLQNLGTLQVIFSEKLDTSYQTTLNYTHELVEPVSRRFSAAFPEVAGSYGGTIGTMTATYILEEDFEYAFQLFPEDARGRNVGMYRAVTENGDWVYCIERTKDDGSFDKIDLPESCPLGTDSHFSVSWEGWWFSGDDTVPFGVYLGRDSENALFFGGSGNQQAAVFRMSKGRWGANPMDWTVLADQEPRTDGTIRHAYRVDVERRTAQYSVDGHVLAKVPLDIPFDRLSVGFYASGVQGVGLDDIIIEEFQ